MKTILNISFLVVSEFLRTFVSDGLLFLVNLHHFVKFASVQILASSSFCCRNV